MKTFLTLLKTETKLALRCGDMILFGIIFPIGIMLLVGCISSPEAILLGFGGIATVGICASGLMGIPLTFAGYRHEKILRRYRVTPVSPATLLAADTVLQIGFAWVSGLAVYLIARFGFGMKMVGPFSRYALTFVLVQAAVYGIGFLIASLVPNVKSANVVCTIVYFPTLFLSGATVPYEIMPPGLQAFSDIFPLTEGIKLLKGAVLGLDPARDLAGYVALAAIALVCFIVSLACFRWE